MVDRVEVGEAGAFDQCKTIEDCVRLMLMDQAPSEAPKLVAIIGAEIERQAGDRAEIVAEPIRLARGFLSSRLRSVWPAPVWLPSLTDWLRCSVKAAERYREFWYHEVNTVRNRMSAQFDLCAWSRSCNLRARFGFTPPSIPGSVT